MTDINTFELPSNPVDIKRIKAAIEEIVGFERLRKDQAENIKDVKDMLKEEFSMPPSLTAKIVKAFHDDDYQNILGDNSKFEFVREAVLGAGDSANDDTTI